MEKKKYNGESDIIKDQFYVSIVNNGVIVRGDFDYYAQEEAINRIHLGKYKYSEDGIDYTDCENALGDYLFGKLRSIARDRYSTQGDRTINLKDFKIEIKIEAREKNGFNEEW